MKLTIIDDDNKEVQIPVESIKINGETLLDIVDSIKGVRKSITEKNTEDNSKFSKFEKRFLDQEKRFAAKETELLKLWNKIK